jgi:phosphoenolpyruvate carboxylase
MLSLKDANKIKAFEKNVTKKFNLYNSLFLSLPFDRISNTGIHVPLLTTACKDGLAAGEEPVDILTDFFTNRSDIKYEAEQIDFMFRVIQYVERQVVLYDSVEEAAFRELSHFGDQLSLTEFIHMLENKGHAEELLHKLNDFSTMIVFTAHPTQFYSPAVLDIITRLRGLIDQNDVNQIDTALQQLGLTSLINARKPTPLDEARNVIYFLRHVYYNAAADLYANLKETIHDDRFDNPAIVQLGFWPGGDRDGNPFVTADTTLAVADELRMALMKSYYGDVKELQRKLTFKDVDDIITGLRNQLYLAMFDRDTIMTYEEILTPLLRIRQLVSEQYNHLFLDELGNLIDKVTIFKTHFAALDIRQNHRVHRDIVNLMLKAAGLVKKDFSELSESNRIKVLTKDTIAVPPGKLTDQVMADTVAIISHMKHIQAKNGVDGCHRYIISNAEDVYSVLFVFALLRWFGWNKETIPVDIIPLFESMEGLKNAETIMRKLFEIPAYRNHLTNRGNVQTIMLGFSDGTKDGGYLQANWSIFKTKEQLTKVCSHFGIKPVFFDGRGGPPARGGGKTHRFYAAQTIAIANNAIQLTIQGQTISSKYGTKAHFIYNCEQLLTAGLSNHTDQKEKTISPEARALMDKLSAISYEKYMALKNHEMFIPYLERKSTLKYYGQSNIGSRPVRRSNKTSLDLADLRAIPFVSAWSQLRQNVPGYFGIGTALSALVNAGQTDALKALFKDVPIFKALILNSMMSLSKTNFSLTRYIAKDPDFAEFWDILYQEYQLSRKMVLLISDYDDLMEEEPISQNSIAIREEIVLPLLVIQQYALQKIEQGSPNKAVYEKIVSRSLYGNINASRNSA